MSTEDEKLTQLETIPKKKYFNYVVHDRWKNISVVLHVMRPKSFQDFKNPNFDRLQINKYYMSKTVFKNSKDTTVCIGHIRHINPFWIDCTQYQESINLLMEGSVQEKAAANKKNFEQFNMMTDFAKYIIQLCVGKLNAWYKEKKLKPMH
eukprot:14179014-Ditylum_brightwellii.AAC.1